MMLVLLLPRALQLDHFVTSDESRWLIRSGNFYRAITKGELEQTYQHGHPGVTIMWLGVTGYLRHYASYPHEVSGQLGWKEGEYEAFLASQNRRPLELLAAGRVAVVLANAVLFGIVFGLTARLVGTLPALWGTLLLALDPMQVGFSRLLHPDGLLSALMLLTLVALLCFFESLRGKAVARGKYWFLILSAAAATLSWLTKTPGFFSIPFVGLLWIINLFLPSRWAGCIGNVSDRTGGDSQLTNENRFWGDLVLPAGLWLGVACGLYLLFWPAMWVAPMATLQQVFQISADYASGGHDNAVFFASRTFFGDPGPTYYFVTYLWRSTPVVQLGIALAILALLGGQKFFTIQERQLSVTLLGFALLFTLFMNLGAKKFDRYLLPIYPGLALTAGLGYVALGRLLTGSWLLKTRPQGRLLAWAALGLVVVGAQAANALPHFPYFISYYNPLLGGGEKAKEVLAVGWGEGMDQAGRYLNNKTFQNRIPEAAAWHDGSTFTYFFAGKATPLDFFWRADYAITYASQEQRKLPARQIAAYFADQVPEHVVRIHGVEYAKVYRMAQLQAADFQVSWLWKNRPVIRLASYVLFPGTVESGSDQELILHLINEGPIDTNLNILVQLVNLQGEVLLRADGWPFGAATSDWQMNEIWLDKYAIPVPMDTPPGLYRVEISFYDPSKLEHLAIVGTADQLPRGDTLILDFLRIEGSGQSGREQSALTPLSSAAQIGNFVRIDGYQVDFPGSDVPAGETLNLRLRWETIGYVPKNLTTFVHLTDSAGVLVAQQDRPPLDGFIPTSLWSPGLHIDDEYTLTIPQGATPGEYRMWVGLYDPMTMQRIPVFHSGAEVADAIELALIPLARTSE